jgi:hypothetical protein
MGGLILPNELMELVREVAGKIITKALWRTFWRHWGEGLKGIM